MKMKWKKPTDRTIKRAYLVVAITVAAVLLCCPMVLAKTPLESINSLSDFLFAAIKAIGVIILLFGVVQIGLSIKSHAAGQRATGFLTLLGGVIIAFAKDILDMIM